MKKSHFIISIAIISLLFFTSSEARDTRSGGKRVIIRTERGNPLIDDSVEGRYQAAAIDTYNLVKFDFEPNDWQGWSGKDLTAQEDTFIHVDDFAGLGGGDFGYLRALEGDKSMWCGARPADDDYMCSWESAPGYGNSWDQRLVSDIIIFSGDLELRFRAVIHCEGAGYDEVYVEYEDGGDWVNLATYGGYHNIETSLFVYSAVATDTTRFRFRFKSDGAWSDQDGLYNTDGAFIVDSLVVQDSGSYYNYEDFESASLGAHSAGIWHAETGPEFGSYAGLQSGMRAVGIDPCNENLSTQIMFFDGSTELADQNVYPGLYVTPRCLNQVEGDYPDGPCQSEMVISPRIDLTRYSTGNDHNQDTAIPEEQLGYLSGVIFRYTVYVDNPMDNLVYYDWGVRSVINGCPEPWQGPTSMIWPEDRGYMFSGYYIDGKINSPNDTIQVNLSVHDMCDVWGGYYGTCENHTPAPWFDNVRIQRYSKRGPGWYYSRYKLFQDNFPPTANMYGFVRADAAQDIAYSDNEIDPGDSITVQITSPLAGGIKSDVNGPMAYVHVKCVWEGDGLPPNPADTIITGPDLIGDDDYWMTYVSDDGLWTKLQGDTARVGDPGYRETALPYYMFDLNDSLFISGYQIEYYFSAVDLADETGYLPENALDGGCFEFACLPFGHNNILYVDDFDGRGTWDGKVQTYMDPALTAVSAAGYPDRYDVNSPSSTVGNGPESRTDAENLGQFYNTIIWDSGELSTGTIGNNTSSSDEADDVQMLYDWASDAVGHFHDTGLIVMGDGVVEDLTNVGASSFLLDILGVQMVSGNYYSTTGGVNGGLIAPIITPVGGSYFDGLDDFWAYGGCPVINRFDALGTDGGTSAHGLAYPDYMGTPYYAGVYNSGLTANGNSMKTVALGFSFKAVRDENSGGALARNELLKRMLDFVGSATNSDVTGDDEPSARFANRLEQNYPNPFNPVTTIEFSLKERGPVSIKIYDVSGRLVKTVLDEVRDAGHHTDVKWKGMNQRGAAVASGVYFYRMNTGSYTDMKKMVLLR